MICCEGTSRRTFIPTSQSPTAVVVRVAGKAAFPTIWRRSLPAKGSPPLQFRRSPLNCSPTHFSLLLPGLELFSSRKRSSSQRLAWQVRHPTLNTQKPLLIFLLITLTLFLTGTSIQQPQLITSPTAGSNTVVSGATGSCATTPQQLTIQLPTQPQPIQGVKTVTYVNPVLSTPATRPTQIQTSPTVTAASTTLQPVKMTPTFAYTPSGRCHICFGRPVKEVVAGFTFLA